jgi:hypothetical protein
MPALRFLVLAALLLVAGCIPWSKSTFRGWPDTPHKFVDCSGAPNGAAACFEQARALCPEGYQLAEHRTDPPINRNQIIVRCGPPLAVEQPEPPAPRPAVRRAPAQPVPK